jgi:hypothetical protein
MSSTCWPVAYDIDDRRYLATVRATDRKAHTMAGSAAADEPKWRKSTHSGEEANCIEVAALAGNDIAIRNDESEEIIVSASRGDFRAFVLGVKAGEFDDLT